MSQTPFEPVRPSLESQLEIVLECDGAVISVAPPARPARRIKKTVAVDAEADRGRVTFVQEQTKKKVAKPVAISYGEHEPSRFVVRMDGAVAKPKEEIRDPFHRTMHRWQTPMIEEIQLNSVYVKAVDLWMEVLEPSFFHAQFTPGDADEAYRESQKGVWSRLRKPFVRWDDRRVSRIQQIPKTAQIPFEIFTPHQDEEDTSIQPEAIAIELMPELAQKPSSETGPVRSTLRDRFQAWRSAAKEEVQDLREEQREFVQEIESAWQAPHLEPKVRVSRVLIGFLGMFCVIALPAGAVSWSRSVSKSVFSAEHQASSLSASSASLTSSPQALSSAFAQIGTLASDIEQSHGLALSLAQVIPTSRNTAETVQALLEAAQEASQAGELLSKGSQRALEGDVATPDERLVRFAQYLSEARPHLDRLFAAAGRMHPESMPENVREKVTQVKTLLLGHQALVAQAEEITQLVLGLIGHNEQRTYLVLFQNEAERRPSGGFMGSYAELVMDRGLIHKLSIPGGGPYDLRSQLRERWIPPQPVQLVASRWEFQDANWAPDFSETADTVRTFWSKSGQPTLDGVIAVNASILPKLLTITGPIEMKDYGKTVTSENVVVETQKAVELEYDKTLNTPKAFISDLNHEVLSRLQKLSKDQWFPLANIAATALETKEIQIHLFRADEQEAIRAFGWTGEWPAVDGFDQLAVIGANLAGQKSDAAIKESVTQKVQIDERGFIQTDLKLHREHTSSRGQQFYGANNVQYVRLYTPAGSELLSGSGFQAPSSSLFDVAASGTTAFPGLSFSDKSMSFEGQTVDLLPDGGRQVFGGWIQLRPGATADMSMRYKLTKSTADMAQSLSSDILTDGAAVSDAYVVHLISQSGAKRAQHLSISYPATWKVIKIGEGMKVVSPGVIEGDIEVLNQDELRYVLFNRG